ncbi:hypothetical protein KIN20_034080 [Parelaphostrongylus tenuis]|uniref:Uncharacterized protein n=1 Tax=Parelaphostrongylus tenuis TaxID=148309 RepID=A0AAD5R9J4_PARTN|nr:hypothetical protein KIN20_034080 [Parelaphostrongylus tenuis]
MCCPSYEASSDNQPTCLTPALTVLDSNGMPLKCDPRTRICPKESMICTAVGLLNICCDRIEGTAQVNNVEVQIDKQISQRRIFRTTIAYEKAIDCPENSIGLMRSDGSRILCNTNTDCPGEDAFCYGARRRSICCELDNIPISEPKISVNSSATVDSSAKIEALETSPQSTEESVESSARVESNVKEYQKKKLILFFTSTSVTQLSETGTNSIMNPSEVNNSNLSASSGDIMSTSKSEQTPTTTNPVAFASLIDRRLSKHQRVDLSSVALPSQLFSQQDKRSMAQHFLMHQIRNGWPYADRFYRPDLDAFSPEQRRDMARFHFSDD